MALSSIVGTAFILGAATWTVPNDIILEHERVIMVEDQQCNCMKRLLALG